VIIWSGFIQKAKWKGIRSGDANPVVSDDVVRA
jgi:hypothetical protein